MANGFDIIKLGNRTDDNDWNTSQGRIGSAYGENVPSRAARHHEVQDDEVYFARDIAASASFPSAASEVW